MRSRRRRRAGKLWVHQLQLTITDFVLEVHDTHHPLGPSLYYDDQKSEAKKRTEAFWDERVPKFLGYFERLLEGSAGHYVTGRKLTYVDLSLFQLVEGLRYAFPKRMKAFERKIPELCELHDRVAAGPISRPISQASAGLPSTRTASSATTRSWIEIAMLSQAGIRHSGFTAEARGAAGMTVLNHDRLRPSIGVIFRLGKLDAVDAADIERDHGGSVGLVAARKHFDAAIAAGLMADRVFVEEVFFQVVFAGAKLKTRRRQERRNAGRAWCRSSSCMPSPSQDRWCIRNAPGRNGSRRSGFCCQASVSPQSGHETIAHPRRIVSIAGQSGRQRIFLDPGADAKENNEDQGHCHSPPRSQ